MPLTWRFVVPLGDKKCFGCLISDSFSCYTLRFFLASPRRSVQLVRSAKNGVRPFVMFALRRSFAFSRHASPLFFFSRCAPITERLEEPGQALLKAQIHQSISGPIPVTQRYVPLKQVPSLGRAWRCMTQPRQPEQGTKCRYCIQAYIQINTSQYLGTQLLAGLIYVTFLDRGPELEKVSGSCKAMTNFQPQDYTYIYSCQYVDHKLEPMYAT